MQAASALQLYLSQNQEEAVCEGELGPIRCGYDWLCVCVCVCEYYCSIIITGMIVVIFC